jgi:hypothetical protein
VQILKGGVLYFAVVFGAGFLLGTFRVLLVAPRVGERSAELMETPLMLVATIVGARWVATRLALAPSPAIRLGVGGLALGLLLAVEFTVVLWLRGLTISSYFASRDPVAGTVYAAALVAFAIMPLLVGRR